MCERDFFCSRNRNKKNNRVQNDTDKTMMNDKKALIRKYHQQTKMMTVQYSNRCKKFLFPIAWFLCVFIFFYFCFFFFLLFNNSSLVNFFLTSFNFFSSFFYNILFCSFRVARDMQAGISSEYVRRFLFPVQSSKKKKKSSTQINNKSNILFVFFSFAFSYYILSIWITPQRCCFFFVRQMYIQMDEWRVCGIFFLFCFFFLPLNSWSVLKF